MICFEGRSENLSCTWHFSCSFSFKHSLCPGAIFWVACSECYQWVNTQESSEAPIVTSFLGSVVLPFSCQVLLSGYGLWQFKKLVMSKYLVADTWSPYWYFLLASYFPPFLSALRKFALQKSWRQGLEASTSWIFKIKKIFLFKV